MYTLMRGLFCFCGVSCGSRGDMTCFGLRCVLGNLCCEFVMVVSYL